MGKLRWYKRDPVAALEGMSNLTLEERGAYNTVLDLIYARDGAVDDDERFIAGWLRCDVRVWKRIRTRLLDLQKLYVADGSLRNSRADAEVDVALGRVASVQELNRIKGRKSGAARREIKALAEPQPEPKTNTTTTTATRPLASLGEPASPVVLPACEIAQVGKLGVDLFGPAPKASIEPKLELFSRGKSDLEAMGVPLDKAGRMLGKWLKDGSTAIEILGAVVEAKQQSPPDPIPYITAILNRTKANGASSHKIRTSAEARPGSTNADTILAGMARIAARSGNARD